MRPTWFSILFLLLNSVIALGLSLPDCIIKRTKPQKPLWVLHVSIPELGIVNVGFFPTLFLHKREIHTRAVLRHLCDWLSDNDNGASLQKTGLVNGFRAVTTSAQHGREASLDEAKKETRRYPQIWLPVEAPDLLGLPGKVTAAYCVPVTMVLSGVWTQGTCRLEGL